MPLSDCKNLILTKLIISVFQQEKKKRKKFVNKNKLFTVVGKK